MRHSVADVLRALKSEGLATDAADALARAALAPEFEAHLPWFLRVAVGFGAWLATSFLLGFLAALAPLDEPILRLIAGLALVAGAVYLRRVSVSEFRKHAAVAGSLAGQGLVITGVSELTDSPQVAAVVLLAMSVVLIRVLRDSVHRFLSTLAACAAAFVAVVEPAGAPAFETVTVGIIVANAFVWRWNLTRRTDETANMLQPVGYALIVALFVALLVATLTHFNNFAMEMAAMVRTSRFTTIALMLALSYLTWTITEELDDSGRRVRFAALAGVLILGLLTLTTPGIIGGAAVLALAFDRRDRVLLGMGVIFLLVFGSVYYYSLHMTLAEKAAVLAGSGLLLLAIRQRIARA